MISPITRNRTRNLTHRSLANYKIIFRRERSDNRGPNPRKPPPPPPPVILDRKKRDAYDRKVLTRGSPITLGRPGAGSCLGFPCSVPMSRGTVTSDYMILATDLHAVVTYFRFTRQAFRLMDTSLVCRSLKNVPRFYCFDKENLNRTSICLDKKALTLWRPL